MCCSCCFVRTTEIGEGKLFAPGNLRATFDNPAYERLISHYLGEKYTLRWVVGDVGGGSSSGRGSWLSSHSLVQAASNSHAGLGICLQAQLANRLYLALV